MQRKNKPINHFGNLKFPITYKIPKNKTPESKITEKIIRLKTLKYKSSTQ